MQRAFVGSLAAALQKVAKEMEDLAFAGVYSRASNTDMYVCKEQLENSLQVLCKQKDKELVDSFVFGWFI